MSSLDLGLEIVRGDRPLSDVSRLGISVSVSPHFFELDERPGLDPVWPSIDDVATGFLVHVGNPPLLREWATVMVGAQCIDLSALAGDPQGDVIAGGLWDVASGAHIGPSVLRAVAAVLSRRPPLWGMQRRDGFDDGFGDHLDQQ